MIRRTKKCKLDGLILMVAALSSYTAVEAYHNDRQLTLSKDQKRRQSMKGRSTYGPQKR